MHSIPAFAVTPSPTELPTNGVVSSGQASIMSGNAAMTINQTTEKAVINWTTFNVGAQAEVTFNQPDARSQTLNRVLGSEASQVYGKVKANGQLLLLNPNGVVIGEGAQVSASGVVASTLDISDQDFQNGNYRFERNGAAGSVVNEGDITTPSTGYVALLGVNVSNRGSIATGKAVLAAGDKVQIPVTESGLITLEAEAGMGEVENTGTLKGTDIELVSSGSVAVRGDSVIDGSNASSSGGTIRLTGKTVKIEDSARIKVNGATGGGKIAIGDKEKTEIVEIGEGARVEASAGARGDGGSITIWSKSLTTVAGSVFAQGGSADGSGGFVETSSIGSVKIRESAEINTLAPFGKTGTWLLDPEFYTIAASGGDETGASVETSLATSNRTISADNTIYVNDAIDWSANTLTLTAGSDIDINAVMTATGTAGLVLNTTSGNVLTGLSGKVNLASGTSLSINGHAYTIINSLGAEGSTTATDLQGIQSNLAGYYALGSDIDASATSGWNSGSGFTPIGTDTPGFTGVFDGLGHTISNLYINLPSSTNVGLFGYAGSSTIRNVGIVNASVIGANRMGILLGMSYANVLNSFSSGSVTGATVVGGLVGYIGGGSVTRTYSNADVTGTGNYIGGLVGRNNYTITDSYATGSVYSTGDYVGGLVGRTFGTVSRSFALGKVQSTSGFVGGLAGYNAGIIGMSYAAGKVTGGTNKGGLIGYNGGTVEGSFWNTVTSGLSTSSNGGTGLTTAQMMAQGSFSGWDFASVWAISEGASYPYLRWQGTPGFITGSGNLSAGQVIRAAVNGEILGSGSTGADGSVYIMLPEGSFGAGDSLLLYNVGGSTSAANAVYAAGSSIASGLSLNASNLWVNSGNGALSTSALVTAKGSLSSDDIRYTVAGSDITLLNNTTFTNTSTGGVSIDNIVNWSANTLTINPSTGDIAINADLNATGTAALVITTSGDINIPLTSGGFSAQVNLASGASLSINGHAYTIINSLGAAGSTTGTDLQGMQGNLAGYFVLGSDIDASSTSGWNSEAGFTPIGNSVTRFGGVFDGLGHTISGLYVNTPSTNYAGLFGYALTSAVKISNVGLVNVDISGATHVGGLAGRLDEGSVHKSYVTGSIVGTTNVGGLIGYASASSISESFATASVTGSGTNSTLGGLVGYNGSTITDSYATGSVQGGSSIGGLTGENSGTITGSYSTGQISASSKAGGLVGRNLGTITDSYAEGGVTATGDYIGGFAGTSETETDITGSHSTGTVSSSGSYVGGFVGSATGATINNSYATGDVSGAGDVGGFAGYATGTSFSLSYAEGNITASSTSSGGFAGRVMSGSLVDTCYSIGTVHGQSSVGGLIGSNRGTVVDSYSLSAVYGGAASGNAFMGGLVGSNYGSITSSYATGIAVSTGSYTGGLVGYNEGSIFSSHATGAVDSTTAWVGGLVGSNSGSITDSFATGSADSDATTVGGLVGENASTGTISTSHSSGAVTGAIFYIGGLVGRNYGTISESYSASNVSGGKNYQAYSYTGGLVGHFTAGSITNSYATGIVTATGYYVGGLVGIGSAGTIIEGSHATGAVSAAGLVGGLIGQNNGSISNSYASGSITGTGTNVGGFAGSNTASGIIDSSNATGSVSGTSSLGGFAGVNSGSIDESYATGALTASAGTAGGFVGTNATSGTIDGSYSSGSVSNTSGSYVGGFAGSNGGLIQASHSTSTVTSSGDIVGGFAGGHSTGSILNSYATGSVSGAGNVGGLVGYTYLAPIIANSYATGDVSGTSTIGGLVGRNTGGATISKSYATGNVSGTVNFFGGFAGLNSDSSIADSYATGNVSGPSYVGGFVSRNSGTITNSYSTGAVTGGGSTKGGLLGDNSGTVTNSYWDTLTSGLSTSNGGVGLTTAQMKAFLTYSSVWSISQSGTTTPSGSTTWIIYDGQTYPLLKNFMTSLTITAIGTSKTYDGSAYASSVASTYSPASYDSGAISGTLSYAGAFDGATNAGSYAITPTGLYSNQQGYDITYVSGTLTITPAALTITAQNQSKRFGVNLDLGNTAFNVEGLLGTDSVGSVALTSAGSSPSATIGSYSIIPSNAVGTGIGNYTIAYVDGELSVTPSATGAQSVVASFLTRDVKNLIAAMRFGCPSCVSEGISVSGGWNSPLDKSINQIITPYSLPEPCGG